jgi:protein TonB
MIVKCVITTEGKLENCRIIKPLPHMEQAVLDSLYSRRYTPVTFQGRPVSVDYVFNIRLKIPNR